MIPNIKPEREVINNSELVSAFAAEGGKVLHCRPVNGLRGVTFAYKRKGGRVTFSTAVQHRHDDFTKKIGTKLAIEHFNEGKCVSLPIKGAATDIVEVLRYVATLVQY